MDEEFTLPPCCFAVYKLQAERWSAMSELLSYNRLHVFPLFCGRTDIILTLCGVEWNAAVLN
jgi:hypothetical protein